MKLKSKQSKTQRKKQESANPEVTITEEKLEKLIRKQFQLEVLQDKVNRSKPILETIYGKFKRKEQKLSKSIQNLSRNLRTSSHMLIKYKQLYQDGLKIMTRNKLTGLFTGETNYRDDHLSGKENSREPEKIDQKQSLLREIKQKYKIKQLQDQRDNNLAMIKREYGEKQKNQDSAQLRLTKQQIYARYQQKLRKDGQSNYKSSSLTAKQLSKKLLEQADLDLQRMASRSKHYPEKENDSQLDERAVKERYLLMQRQKLMSL